MSESATLPGNFLQTFWDLASDEEAERIGAALRLVTHLREQQVCAHVGVWYVVRVGSSSRAG